MVPVEVIVIVIKVMTIRITMAIAIRISSYLQWQYNDSSKRVVMVPMAILALSAPGRLAEHGICLPWSHAPAEPDSVQGWGRDGPGLMQKDSNGDP